MDEDRRVQSFYRVAKSYPSDDDEYRSAQEKYGDPRPSSSLEVRTCWTGLSAYGNEAAARQQAKKMRGRLGALIVRYDTPMGSGIRWQQSFGRDHYTLFGDKEELKGYLTDFLVDV